MESSEIADVWDKAGGLAPDEDPARIFFGGGVTSPTEDFDRRVVELLPAVDRLLDVGCGTGWLSALLTPDRVGMVRGVDLSPASIHTATARGTPSTEWAVGDYRDETGTFDAVLAVQVLNYEPDLAAFFGFARARLTDGGWLLVSDMEPVGRLRRAAPHMHRRIDVQQAAAGARFELVAEEVGYYRPRQWAAPIMHRLACHSFRHEPTRLLARWMYRALKVATGWRWGEPGLYAHLYCAC